MTGTWQDYIQRVLKTDEAEIALWQKIADMVAGNHCKCIINMMIQKEKEEMKTLRMLMKHGHDDPYQPCPDYSPGHAGYKPGYDHDYAPGYEPGYDRDYDSGYKPGYDPDHAPGYKPGYRPDYGHGKDKDFGPIPYAEEDKEDK